MAGRRWTTETPVAYRLTSAERAELAQIEDAENAEREEIAADYRKLIVALGEALKSENVNHPMLPALRAYYRSCASYDLIFDIVVAVPATLAGQTARQSVQTIVWSSQKRGLPVAKYFADVAGRPGDQE